MASRITLMSRVRFERLATPVLGLLPTFPLRLRWQGIRAPRFQRRLHESCDRSCQRPLWGDSLRPFWLPSQPWFRQDGWWLHRSLRLLLPGALIREVVVGAE